nr:hypothetical protein GCM10020093_024230 [Planobispora longispora]
MANGSREPKPAAGRGRQASGAQGEAGGARTAESRTGEAKPGQASRRSAARTGIRTRRDRYLVAVMPPTDVRAVLAQLEEDPACTVVRTVGTVHPAGAFPRLAAVEMPADRAAALARVPGLHIEPDQPLGRAAVRYDGRAGHAAFHGLGAPDAHELDAPAGTLRTAAVEVGDDAGRPIEGAEVSLYGTAFTAYTGAEGRAELTVPPTSWPRSGRWWCTRPGPAGRSWSTGRC